MGDSTFVHVTLSSIVSSSSNGGYQKSIVEYFHFFFFFFFSFCCYIFFSFVFAILVLLCKCIYDVRAYFSFHMIKQSMDQSLWIRHETEENTHELAKKQQLRLPIVEIGGWIVGCIQCNFHFLFLGS